MVQGDMVELRIVVIDDHPLFREGVVNALSIDPRLKVVGQASTGTEALSIIRELLPDVAVLDINLPGLNGLQVANQLSNNKIPTKVVLLTAYDDDDQIIHAALAGACAYCSKEVHPSQLIETILDVAGGLYIVKDRKLTAREFTSWLDELLEQTHEVYSDPGSPFHPLSDREMEVLSCVVKGMSNKEIAVTLGISHQTVKNHVTSILRKFNVEDRTQAVVYALKHGWVKLTDREKNLQE